MKIHHLRNATFVIESGEKFILIDPMLGPKGSGMPFTFFRFKPRKNPTVDLPVMATELLEKVTHCLITHLHPDHIDPAAIDFLKARNIPVVCSYIDQKQLRKKGLQISSAIRYWQPEDYLGGRVIGIPAIHGYGFVRKIAGPVMGFYLDLPDELSVYISSDTIYTEEVDRALRELKPDIAVFAAGMAQLDFGDMLLMNPADIMNFIRNAPGKVIANHLEALNHCPNTRKELRADVQLQGLSDKVFIPEDGEVLVFEK
jgi:L-ascorbate metabolism protein UlaG (beta-lactamase superfamily)